MQELLHLENRIITHVSEKFQELKKEMKEMGKDLGDVKTNLALNTSATKELSKRVGIQNGRVTKCEERLKVKDEEKAGREEGCKPLHSLEEKTAELLRVWEIKEELEKERIKVKEQNELQREKEREQREGKTRQRFYYFTAGLTLVIVTLTFVLNTLGPLIVEKLMDEKNNNPTKTEKNEK